MKIALGADHAGFELKDKIRQHLVDKGIAIDDRGTSSSDSVDYPDYSAPLPNRLPPGGRTGEFWSAEVELAWPSRPTRFRACAPPT